MKILLSTYTYPPFFETGGPPIKVRAIAEGLAERGHEVTVLTANHARPSTRVERRSGGVDIVYLRELFRYRFVPVSFGGRSFIRRIREFDVVHIFGIYDLTGPLVARACRRHGIPYVVEPLGMYRAIIRSFLKKRVYQWAFGKNLVSGAARVVATSEQEREELVLGGVPANRLSLRRNGIDLRQFERLPQAGAFRESLGIAEGEPITLFLGRLAAKKHPELLLEAFTREALPGHLVFVGPDEDASTNRLRAQAARAGVGDRVIFTGPIYDEEQKTEALVDADVFVLPSESENFGNSVAEALACGTPAVVSDRCGIAPIVDGRGAVVVPVDAKSVGQAIGSLLGDAKMRGELGALGRATSQELSWKEPLDETEALYADLIA